MNNPEQNVKMVWSSCNVNCGNRCPLRLYVKDGEVVRVEPDNKGEDSFSTHEIRGCLRGRALRKWIYSPDRLIYPLKRIGKRGEGKFERISWDNALDYIADKLRKVIDIYGNEAIFRIYGTGNIGGVVSSREQIDRLMNMLGGQLSYYNTYSTAQISHGVYYTYGANESGNPLTEIVNSKLVVLFGNNPAETRMSGGSLYEFVKSRKNSGAHVIIIDPRYTDTAACFADEWIPIRPGTDSALVSGLAHVLIAENMIDKDFLERYCVGYDQSTMLQGIPSGNSYKDYILGNGKDRIPKTPAWASSITGIPAERIIQLSKQLGKIKPAYIAQGWGPQRHANGEHTARAICMLPILTGNIGIKGGNSGDREVANNTEFPKIPVGTNPIKTSIPCFLWTKAIFDHENFTNLTDGLKQKQKLETPIKFMWCFASNILMNQHSDIRKTHSILSDETLCEMIVLIDNVMTASAHYADIVLPGTSSFEETDLAYQAHADEMDLLILRQQAIKPMGESLYLLKITSLNNFS